MGRLSTLVYAPVLFTWLTLMTVACGPRASHRAAARLNAPVVKTAANQLTKPGALKANAVDESALVEQIEAEKKILKDYYNIPFRRNGLERMNAMWDPSDYHASVRTEIEGHLRKMITMYQTRLAVRARPDAMLDVAHAQFILAEFERADLRAKGH